MSSRPIKVSIVGRTKKGKSSGVGARRRAPIRPSNGEGVSRIPIAHRITPRTTAATTPSPVEDVKKNTSTAASKKKRAVRAQPDTSVTASALSLLPSTFVMPRLPALPTLQPGRMRAVAYIGVFYVCVGVSAASYALAGLYGDDQYIPLFHSLQSDRYAASTLTSTSGSDTDTLSSSGSSDGGTDSGSSSTETIETSNLLDTSDSATNNDTTSDTSGGSITTSETTTGTIDRSTTLDTISDDTTTRTTTTDTKSATTIEATTTPTYTTTTLTATLQPAATLSLSESSPLSDDVKILIEVAGAHSVELVALSETRLVPFYLGTAVRQSDTEYRWRFAWNTETVPNGYYRLYARITNPYGTYESERKSIKIENIFEQTVEEPATTLSSPETIEAVSTVEQEMESPLRDEEGEIQADEEIDVRTQDTDSVAEVTDEKSATEENLETEDRAEDLLKLQMIKFKEGLLTLIERFAAAYRAKDHYAQQFIKDEIVSLKTQTLRTLIEREILPDEEYVRVAQEIDDMIAQEIARIETRERMIEERVGNTVSADTDKDGIVDYDEIHLYNTDPLSADTDNDGFTDGGEIISGFDPVDPKGEAAVSFENPEERGPVRDDILTVTSVSTEEKDGDVIGRFQGTALPNSFVTLYIFSTPVILTVRTDAEGAWSYVFEKELEDGSHTLFVGITDNAGRIIAKSQPFPFVKTAEAFSEAPRASVAQVATPEEPSLLSAHMLLLLVALTLTLLGISLIALGAYFMRPREALMAAPVPAS